MSPPRHPFPAPLPEAAAPAVEVVRRLSKSGHAAYLVGGAVRDLVLDLPPGDFDVATDARPERLVELFPGAKLVGAAFGVVIVPLGEARIETATFRREGPYSDGRHPDAVDFAATAEEDARRRDFTVNALYLDPERLEILDPQGGLTDCGSRTLRTVGRPADRFAEDALRLLRAPRIAAQCGLAIDPETRAALADCREGLKAVAAERIGQELARILTGPAPADGMETLLGTGLLELFLPEAAAMHGVPQPPEYHPEGCVWTHTMRMLRGAPGRPLDFALAVLLHDVAKPPTLSVTDRIRFNGHARLGAEMALEIAARLRYSREAGERAADLVAQHLRFIDVQAMKPATLKRFLRQPRFADHLELHRLDCLASHGDLSNHAYCLEKLAELAEEDLAPPPLLRGRDLLEMGYAAGPRLGRILEDLETAQLEGAVADAEAARRWVRERFPRED